MGEDRNEDIYAAMVYNTSGNKKLALWETFLQEASEMFLIDSEDITSIVAGITRTGFCTPKISPERGDYKVIYEVTPYFTKLKEYM